MPIKSLKLSNFRNFSEKSINLSDSINLILGRNGVGKSTVLEALYLLGTGRSTRVSNLSKIITFDSQYTAINAVINQDNELQSIIEYQRNINGARKLIFNGKNQKSLADIARFLPICSLDGNSFRGLSSTPHYRRQLFDWGMFHVKHSFLDSWRKFNKILEQRNALLKNKAPRTSFITWDTMYIEAAVILIEARQEYFNKLRESFSSFIPRLLPSISNAIDIRINHGIGADADISDITKKSDIESLLKQKLELNYQKDFFRGYTSTGPHRADIVFLYHNDLAKEIVSRGQEKMLIIAFYLAQLAIIKQCTGKKCTVLLDDIAAELDIKAHELLYKQLLELEHQLVITAIQKEQIPLDLTTLELFHVEQL